MPDQTAGLQPNQPTTSETFSALNTKPIVVGLYGLPGSGKTFLLDQLKQNVG